MAAAAPGETAASAASAMTAAPANAAARIAKIGFMQFGHALHAVCQGRGKHRSRRSGHRQRRGLPAGFRPGTAGKHADFKTLFPAVKQPETKKSILLHYRWYFNTAAQNMQDDHMTNCIILFFRASCKTNEAV